MFAKHATKMKAANNSTVMSSARYRAAGFYFLGVVIYALLIWAVQSFLVYQNQVKVTQSAELSVNSLASFATNYVEKHKLLVKSVVNHHQERLVELAKRAGYPYDYNEIESEIRTIFPAETEFAIVDKTGDIVIGSHLENIGQGCKDLLKKTMQQSLLYSMQVKAHRGTGGKSHFYILYPMEHAGSQAGLWVKLTFSQLETFISDLNIEDYQLVITELISPNIVVVGNNEWSNEASSTANNLNFGFIHADENEQNRFIEDTLALAPVKGVSWQVRALINHEIVGRYNDRVALIALIVFVVGSGVVLAIMLLRSQLQNERSRVQQDAEHDQLFNAGPTVLIEKSADRSMLIRYASPNVVDLFHLEIEQLSGQSYLTWIYKEDVEEVRSQLINAYNEGVEKVEMVYRVLSKSNGGFKWIYDLTQITYDQSGQPDTLRGYITSIHAQKMAEKNATDLIQSIPEAIFVTEFNGQVIDMNRAAETLLSGNKEELKDINFSNWIMKASLQDYLQLRNQSLRASSNEELFINEANYYKNKLPSGLKESKESEQKQTNKVLRLRNLQGREFAVEISFQQIELNNQTVLIQVVRDVTLQFNAQQQLSHAKEEAEALARARSRFVATISHEIRTPMNGVLGMADLLSETNLSSGQHKYLAAIQESGSTLLKIINGVLDFAKLDEGHIVLEHLPINLESLIQESIHMLSVQAEEKSLALNIHYASNVEKAFLGDELRIKQMLVNLISNAIKFTEQGYVEIRVEQENNLLDDYQAMVIRVRDTGIGIDKSNQHKLFDSFTQADDSTSRQFGGTGLGLAITKHIVDLMNGEIGIQSELDKGSEFWVRLPLKLDPEAGVSKKTVVRTIDDDSSNSTPKLSNQTVLVVEDNQINQDVIRDFLKRMNIKVDIAENGLQGVDYWRMNPDKYGLILMDCQMPVMDGFEATQIIRQEAQQMLMGQAIPIIALTANVIDEGRKKCMEVGMNDFLAKPIERALFEKTVVKWLNT